MITCSFEDGGHAKLRHVTINAIIVKDGKVLLCKRGTFKGKKMLESGKWSLIGGFMGRDETLEEALKREAMEETGWEIDSLRLIHVKDNPDRPHEDRQNVEFAFTAKAVRKISGSDEEVTRLKWFSVDELPPKEQIAFDHRDDLDLYRKLQTEKIPLPVIGKIGYSR